MRKTWAKVCLQNSSTPLLDAQGQNKMSETLSAGTFVLLAADAIPGYHEVITEDGRVGFISRLSSFSVVLDGTVMQATVPIHSSPSKQSSVVDVARKGDRIQYSTSPIAVEASTWLFAKTGSVASGYIDGGCVVSVNGQEIVVDLDDGSREYFWSYNSKVVPRQIDDSGKSKSLPPPRFASPIWQVVRAVAVIIVLLVGVATCASWASQPRYRAGATVVRLLEMWKQGRDGGKYWKGGIEKKALYNVVDWDFVTSFSPPQQFADDVIQLRYRVRSTDSRGSPVVYLWTFTVVRDFKTNEWKVSDILDTYE